MMDPLPILNCYEIPDEKRKRTEEEFCETLQDIIERCNAKPSTTI